LFFLLFAAANYTVLIVTMQVMQVVWSSDSCIILSSELS